MNYINSFNLQDFFMADCPRVELLELDVGSFLSFVVLPLNAP